MTATTYRTDPVDHDRACEDDLALRGAYEDDGPRCPHCGLDVDFATRLGLCGDCSWSVGR